MQLSFMNQESELEFTEMQLSVTNQELELVYRNATFIQNSLHIYLSSTSNSFQMTMMLSVRNGWTKQYSYDYFKRFIKCNSAFNMATKTATYDRL